MAIPVQKNNLLNITGLKNIDPPAANPAPAGNQNAFLDLLRNTLQQTATSTAAGTAPAPLNKEQLALLVQTIQLQLNRQLFNVVFNNGAGINYLPTGMLTDFGKEIKSSSAKSSNFCHTPPKNDTTGSSSKFDSIIEKAASKYDVDPDLIRSVIKAESNFNPQATSPKGAMGLMQLMPDTARDLGVKNAYDAEENIMGGTRYLKSLLDRYKGKVNVALAAYNWGMGNVEKKPDRLPEETVSYIDRINKYYKTFKA